MCRALGDTHRSFLHNLRNPSCPCAGSVTSRLTCRTLRHRGLEVLGIALALEVIALATLSSFTSLGLGLASLSLAVLAALCWCGTIWRDVRLGRSRQRWIYFRVNDRLDGRENLKRFSGPLNESTVPPPKPWFRKRGE